MKFLSIKINLSLGIFILALSPLGLQAETGSLYELSARANIVGGNGKPSNDILGIGFILHRKLSDDWYLGFGLDIAPEFDVETPNDELGIDSVSETDALGDMYLFTVVAERRYMLASEGWTGFWNLGAGVAYVDVDDADGGVEGGGRFDIKIDADTEYVLIAGVGALQQLGEHWSARYEATAEQHFADWDIEDKVSGRTDSYDDYTVVGVRIGLNYRF